MNDNTKCKKGDVKRCKSSINTNDQLNQQYTRGEYCVDYNVLYEEGDEFKVVDNVSTAQECRFECLTTQRSDGCRFYSWSKLNKKCYLMNEELWFPTIEKNAVSGTLDGLCKTQSFGQLGECECQKIEIYDEYYDEADLVSTGLIDVRSGVSSGDVFREYLLRHLIHRPIRGRSFEAFYPTMKIQMVSCLVKS